MSGVCLSSIWKMGHRDLKLLCTRYMMPTSRRAAARFWRMLK